MRRDPSKFTQLGSGIESHPAWRGDVSFTEGAKLLQGHPPFTFILSTGFDKDHYFLSFVDADGKVKYRNVRLFLKNGEIYYMNGASGGGGGRGYESIDNLIPSCLNCPANVCRPYPRERSIFSLALHKLIELTHLLRFALSQGMQNAWLGAQLYLRQPYTPIQRNR